MYRTATINIYDCLTDVVANARVRTQGDAGWENDSEEGHWYSTFPGVGEIDERRWLLDALRHLIQQLEM